MPCPCEMSITRRALLGTAGALFAWSFVPRFAHAAGVRDTRFVAVVLRGALDGLSAVAPVADPDYEALRETIAISRDGPNPALPLDGFFALHPAMPTFGRLYKVGQALVVHAVATGYRERSHFDGQDVLESGQPGPGRIESGWLNRVITALPAGERAKGAGAVLGVGPVAPLIVRGPAPLTGWAPPVVPRAGADLAARVLDLYSQRDPDLARSLAQGLEIDRLTPIEGMPRNPASRSGADNGAGIRQLAEGAARLLAADDGPRIAAVAFEGWDTHANEGGATGRLAQLFAGLDGAFAAFESGLGERWEDTVILVMTEFGRTVRVNGTVGTDHGTGTVAFLLGGAVKGGRVVADWPGLKPGQLLEQRDLKPTLDLRAVAKGVLADLFGLTANVLGRDVFPETQRLKPIHGLVA